MDQTKPEVELTELGLPTTKCMAEMADVVPCAVTSYGFAAHTLNPSILA